MTVPHDPSVQTAGPGNAMTVDEIIAQAEANNAADLAEHGRYIPNATHRAEVAYAAQGIGLWELSHDNHAAAARWLQQALDLGVEEARPLLRLCHQVLRSAESTMIETDDLITPVCTSAAEQDTRTDAPTQRPARNATPFFDDLDGAGVLHTASRRVEAVTTATWQTLQTLVAAVNEELLSSHHAHGDLTHDNVLTPGVDNDVLDAVIIDTAMDETAVDEAPGDMITVSPKVGRPISVAQNVRRLMSQRRVAGWRHDVVALAHTSANRAQQLHLERPSNVDAQAIWVTESVADAVGPECPPNTWVFVSLTSTVWYDGPRHVADDVADDGLGDVTHLAGPDPAPSWTGTGRHQLPDPRASLVRRSCTAIERYQPPNVFIATVITVMFNDDPATKYDTGICRALACSTATGTYISGP